MQNDRWMTRQEVCELFGGISRTALRNGVENGTLPAPITISRRSQRWLRQECEAALERMLRERRNVSRAA